MNDAASKILDNPSIEIELVKRNDCICGACRHMSSENACGDMFPQFYPPLPKRIYNDEVNRHLFRLLKLKAGTGISAKKFLLMILSRPEKIITLCTHPGQDEYYTRKALAKWSSIRKKTSRRIRGEIRGNS